MIDYKKLTYAQAIELHCEGLQKDPNGDKAGQNDSIIKTRATTPRGIAKAVNRFYGEKYYTPAEAAEALRTHWIERIDARPAYIVIRTL